MDKLYLSLVEIVNWKQGLLTQNITKPLSF